MRGQRTLSQRRVGHGLYTALALPGQQRKLDGARLQAVVELIALRRGAKRQRLLGLEPLREFVHVEIADAELANEPPLPQIVQAAQCLPERLRATPVQQVEIQIVTAHACDRSLAGTHGALARSMIGQHFADDEQLIAPRGTEALQGPADDALGAAVTVHLGRVEQPITDRQRMRDRGNLLRLRGARSAHLPGAQTDAAWEA